MNTITAVCHSVTKGYTVVLYQTEDIHECFYDLFNLRFRVIEDESCCHYYANVAIGGLIKPLPVHPDFQCVVVLKQSKLKDVPAPFLNRFEKFLLSHEIILDSIMLQYPGGVRHMVHIIFEQVTHTQ